MNKKSDSRDSRYEERCRRSLGIMTPEQLQEIRGTRIAVAGLGLGGSVFINLVRLGFEKFHVADPDVYERTNINRQRAAKETTIGSRKDDCLIQEARAINPDVEIAIFREGVNAGNLDRFLEGVDWLVDAVDVFAMTEKIDLNAEAARRKIPTITCVAIGFGAAITVFDETTPTFGELSGLDRDATYEKNIDRFAKFVTPEIPRYMTDQLTKGLSRSSHIPFVVPGVEISAALVSTEITKHLLGIGERAVAPHGIYFDPVAVKAERFIADWREREPLEIKRARTAR